MAALLDELAKSIEQKVLRVSLYPSWAIVAVGTVKEKDHFEADFSWRVEPNHSSPPDEPLISSTSEEQPGIRVEKTEYFRSSTCHSRENRQVFQTEAEVMEYLAGKIATKVAWYQHSDELRAGQQRQ
jgi:ribonuclease I